MASPELYGRVAIITGTTRGIGLATAKAFLREGARVVGCAPAADDVPPSLPEGYVHHACDVSNPQQVEDLVAVTVGAFGRIDCLVNNAGVHPLQRPIDDFEVAEFNALLATNLIGPFVACKAALPLLRKSRGTIVNVGSTVGLYGQDGSVTYVASKAALSGLTKALAIDEARHGVRVNCVCPGAILTPSATGEAARDSEVGVAGAHGHGRGGGGDDSLPGFSAIRFHHGAGHRHRRWHRARVRREGRIPSTGA